MAFSTASFFAGVGTVFAAVTIGFAGGAMITTAPKMEPNRLERVAAGNAANAPMSAAAAKAESPAAFSVPDVKAEASPISPASAKSDAQETSAAPDRMVSMTPAPASQQVVPPQLQPAMAKNVAAKEDVASQADNAKKVREGELRKQAERENERRAEQRRRKRQEIEGAVNAVKRMQRDGVLQAASQQGDDTPRLGFFGQD